MSANKILMCAVVSFTCGGIASLARAQCEFDWDAAYCPPGTNGAVYASVV